MVTHARAVSLVLGSLIVVGSVLRPTARAVTLADPPQAPPPAMSVSEMADLFKEKAGLGKEKERLQEELKPLLNRGQTLEREETTIKQDQEAFDRRYDAAAATCNDKDWSQPSLAHCYKDDADLQAANAELNQRIRTHKEAVTRLEAEAGKILQRQRAIEERLKKIEALLAAQQSFATANEQCKGKQTLEAQVTCMEVEWDRATDPGYTVPDPPQVMRTPEQAIEEYRRSGPPTPLIRPKGGGKEPPPPAQ